jgi:hypothetical protein
MARYRQSTRNSEAMVVETLQAFLACGDEQLKEGSDVHLAAVERFNGLFDQLKATPNGLFLAISIAAVTVRWASRETGRSNAEILDEFAQDIPWS